MRKLAVVAILALIIGILVGCTNTSKMPFDLSYDAESRNYTVVNTNNKSYEDLEVRLRLTDSNGYTQEITERIGTLEPGKSYTFKITDENAEKIEFAEYSYYVPVWYYVFIVFVIIIVIVGFALIIFA